MGANTGTASTDKTHCKAWLDKEFKQAGVQNVSFPLFVSKHALEQEKSHIEGFAAEVAIF